jgi:hypothetical protein
MENRTCHYLIPLEKFEDTKTVEAPPYTSAREYVRKLIYVKPH